jgi:hypothetical protein
VQQKGKPLGLLVSMESLTGEVFSATMSLPDSFSNSSVVCFLMTGLAVLLDFNLMPDGTCRSCVKLWTEGDRVLHTL